MYLCLDCRDLFDEPIKYTEKHSLDTPPYETWFGCPSCGGGYIEAKQCDICKDWITDEYIEINNGTFVCDNCYCIKNIEDI